MKPRFVEGFLSEGAIGVYKRVSIKIGVPFRGFLQLEAAVAGLRLPEQLPKPYVPSRETESQSPYKVEWFQVSGSGLGVWPEEGGSTHGLREG